MIVDNLTKFNQRKKVWLTPKHPLYRTSKEFRIMYGAIIFMQAEIDRFSSPLNNFELQRLLTAGLQLDLEDMAKVLRYSNEKSEVIEYLLEAFTGEKEKYFMLLDMANVSLKDLEIKEKEMESLQLFAKMFQVPLQDLSILIEFAKAAAAENIKTCRELLHRIHLQGIELTPVEMKYFIAKLWDKMECTQEMIEHEKVVRIVDRCEIVEDLVLTEGMQLYFDHAEVRIVGNILLMGGELLIEDSTIIRKGDTHRAAVNMKDVHSRIYIKNTVVDCRNRGMFIRAEAGNLQMKDSSITQTNRGAAIRFWGNKIIIENTVFSDCYSHEDGGALMIRTPDAVVKGCKFKNCEAKRGGAIFGVEGNQIIDCHFMDCLVAEYGAAIFYNGLVRANVHHLKYEGCYPEGVETVQYLSRMTTYQITGEYHILVSTILDCPLMVETEGSLIIENANIYLNYPIKCRGSLQLKNVKIISNYLENEDMIVLEHSKGCRIHHCELNGMCRASGIYASGSRMVVSKSLFRNMHGGRAIYDAYSPVVQECIFNLCDDGAIYCQNGEIERSFFVNCRGKSGAGVLMYGNHGHIEQCNFRRCISDYSGGAIDRSLGQQVIKCLFAGCRPDNIS